MKKVSLLFVLVIYLLFFTGCSWSKQLHERLIIQGIGVDKDNDNYVVSVQFLSAENLGAEGLGEKLSTITSNGKSVNDALINITKQVGKDPLYSHNLIILIGKKTALDGINDVIDFFIRHYECRPSVPVVVVNGKALDIMNLKLGDETVTSNKIYEISNAEKLNSHVISSNVLDIVSCLKGNIVSASTMCIDYYSNDKEKSIFTNSTAIFDQDKLIGFLDADESRGALLINDSVVGGTEVIDIEDVGNVTYTLTNSKSKIDVQIIDDIPIFNINVKVDANVYEIDRNFNDELKNDYIYIMEMKLKDRLNSLIIKSINKSLFDYKSDIFNFAKILKIKDTKYFKKIQDNIISFLINSTYKTNVEASIKMIGQETNFTIVH